MNIKKKLQIVDILFKNLDGEELTEADIDLALESLVQNPLKRKRYKEKMIEKFGPDVFSAKVASMNRAVEEKGEEWRKDRASKGGKGRIAKRVDQYRTREGFIINVNEMPPDWNPSPTDMPIYPVTYQDEQAWKGEATSKAWDACMYALWFSGCLHHKRVDGSYQRKAPAILYTSN